MINFKFKKAHKITYFRRVILEVEVDVRVEQDGLVWQVWLVWWA